MNNKYSWAFWDLGYNIIVERPDVPYLISGGFTASLQMAGVTTRKLVQSRSRRPVFGAVKEECGPRAKNSRY
eukprot:1181814-Prorocentrum_minimum.AAC.2